MPQLLLSAPLLFQHLDLLVRDSSHPSKAWQGHVGDVIQVRRGRRAGKMGQAWGASSECSPSFRNRPASTPRSRGCSKGGEPAATSCRLLDGGGQAEAMETQAVSVPGAGTP